MFKRVIQREGLLVVKFYNSSIDFEIKIPRHDAFPSIVKFLRGNSKDLLNKLNGIFLLVPFCKTYFEPMAGIGFSSCLVKALYNPVIDANDIDGLCVEFLRQNLPKANVSQKDIKVMEYWEKKETEVTFFDNSLSFKSMAKKGFEFPFFEALKITQTTFVWTDVFPFSIIPFNEKRLTQYLKEVDLQLSKEKTGFRIHSIYLYEGKQIMLVRADKDYVGGFTVLQNRNTFKYIKKEGLFVKDRT